MSPADDRPPRKKQHLPLGAAGANRIGAKCI
jgi:hypothetical protein